MSVEYHETHMRVVKTQLFHELTLCEWRLAKNTQIHHPEEPLWQAALFHLRWKSLSSCPKPGKIQQEGSQQQDKETTTETRCSPGPQWFVSQMASVFSFQDFSLSQLLISGPQKIMWFKNLFALSRQQQLRHKIPFYFILLLELFSSLLSEGSKHLTSKLRASWHCMFRLHMKS